MTQTSINYAKVLYHLSVSRASVEEAYQYITQVPELTKVLKSPVARRGEIHRVIERIFPKELHNFMKVVCDNHDAGLIGEICEAYHTYSNEMEGILSAQLYYVTKPDEAQLEKIKRSLCGRYHKKAVELTLKEDKSLIGGFIIQTHGREMDWSLKGRIRQLNFGMNVK